MKRTLLLRLASVALITTGALFLPRFAMSDSGPEGSDPLPFHVGEGLAQRGDEGSLAPLLRDNLTAEQAPAKGGKLDWHLAQLAQAGREAAAQGRAIGGQTPSLLPKRLRDMVAAGLMRISEAGEVHVYLATADPASAAQSALALGGRIERVDAKAGLVQAWQPIGNLDDLAADPAVRFVRLPDYGFVLSGSATTEGDAVLNSDDVRGSFGVDGSGVTVGVISDGVGGIGDAQASGDLPAVDYSTCDVVIGDPQATGAEGTAMLEIVHDLAPGASLMFGHFGMGTSLDFNAAVDCLAQNADVVIDDIGWFNAGPYDGTSYVSQNTAAALNHVGWPIRGYFNAGGNSAASHYQESYLYSGYYVDDPPDLWYLHEFSGTSETSDAGQGLLCEQGQPEYCGDTLFLQPDGLLMVWLQWNDPFGGSGNDYDLWLLDENEPMLYLVSAYIQDGDDDPTEAFAWVNETAQTQVLDILIGRYAGSARTFDMFLWCSGCLTLSNNAIHNFNTVSSSVPNNCDAGGSPVPIISLGAIDQADPGHNNIEYFSSRGPTNDARTKPDATAIDGVSITGAADFPVPFFGTSAAAPHAGGVAALLLQCDPSLDRAGLRSALLTTAVDLGDAGTDNTYGAGRLDALAAALSGVCPDADGDQLTDAVDNCPADYNPGQENADGAIGNGPGIPGDDATVPNAAVDDEGDACETDGDADNDGLPDGSDPDPGGDVTYDDNGDGNPAAGCLGGSDPADDGPSWDTNCDGVRDGVAPIPPGAADADGDGLPDDYEVNKWGTCPDGVSMVGLLDCSTVSDPQDTDGDGTNDCREVYDTDGNELVLFPTDGLNAVKAALLPLVSFGRDGDFDFDGNNLILFPTDGLNGVKAALLAGFCIP